MKKWNNPTIETLELNKTENGWKWWHKEYIDFFGGLTLGEQVTCPGHNNGTQEQGKGDDEHTSSTSDAVDGNS